MSFSPIAGADKPVAAGVVMQEDFQQHGASLLEKLKRYMHAGSQADDAAQLQQEFIKELFRSGKGLHRVGVNALAETIHKDWQKRRAMKIAA
jgi:hypothetical protein